MALNSMEAVSLAWLFGTWRDLRLSQMGTAPFEWSVTQTYEWIHENKGCPLQMSGSQRTLRCVSVWRQARFPLGAAGERGCSGIGLNSSVLGNNGSYLTTESVVQLKPGAEEYILWGLWMGLGQAVYMYILYLRKTMDNWSDFFRIFFF